MQRGLYLLKGNLVDERNKFTSKEIDSLYCFQSNLFRLFQAIPEVIRLEIQSFDS